MKQLIGLTGISLACFAAWTYFEGPGKGICAGLFVFGMGLVLDAFKK